MTIPVHKEPDDLHIMRSGIIEDCHFCRRPTRYWHENTNNPVCPGCSTKHKVAELPDWGKAIRANKRKARANP